VLGFEHQIGPRFAASVNYVYRKYDQYQWNGQPINNLVAPLIGVSTTGSDFYQTSFTPAAADCPATQDARCPTVTYFAPNFGRPVPSIEPTLPFHRTSNGVELTATKRMSQRWLLDTSFSYNSAVQHYEPGSYQDPTNVALRDGNQYDYLTGGSGLGNVYVNA